MITEALNLGQALILKNNMIYALPANASQVSWQSPVGGSHVLVSLDGINFSSLGTVSPNEVKSVFTSAIFIKSTEDNTIVVAKSINGTIVEGGGNGDSTDLTGVAMLDEENVFTKTQTIKLSSPGDALAVMASGGASYRFKVMEDGSMTALQDHAVPVKIEKLDASGAKISLGTAGTNIYARDFTIAVHVAPPDGFVDLSAGGYCFRAMQSGNTSKSNLKVLAQDWPVTPNTAPAISVMSTDETKALWKVLKSGAIEMLELTGITAPPANSGKLYFEDNGAGKTRFMVRFPTGDAVQLAIES